MGTTATIQSMATVIKGVIQDYGTLGIASHLFYRHTDPTGRTVAYSIVGRGACGRHRFHFTLDEINRYVKMHDAIIKHAITVWGCPDARCECCVGSVELEEFARKVLNQ